MARIIKEQIKKINSLLDEHGELPPEWKWVLFPPEKQEYELVYGGKQREEEIISQTMALPLQNVRTFNNGPGKKKGQWYNRLIFGDNLQAMKSLLNDSDIAGKVKLIYIDPPFATKKDFKGTQDQKAYQDKIEGAEFIEFLRKRLVLLKELLAKDGTIYIHLDSRKSHYIKVVMDELFPYSEFAEISWVCGLMGSGKYYPKAHETILCYKKNGAYFNPPERLGYSTRITGALVKDKDGWYYTRGQESSGGRNYLKTYICNNSKLTKEQAIEEANCKRPQAAWSVWIGKESLAKAFNDNHVGTYAYTKTEKTGYPTQKPERLLKRIIEASSRDGDVILDVFAGSGTTCAVAEKLGRRWVGIDSGKLAIYTVQKRLLNLKAKMGNKGRKLKAKQFVLQNAGLYDFATLKDLSWEDWRFFALQLFECRDKPHDIGNLKLDGMKGTSSVLVFNWKKNPGELISEETISDIHAMIGKKIGKKFYIIAPMMAFDFFQDYVDKDGVRYYALRIPYNVIKELHIRDFQVVLQARKASNVNDIQDAYGFSFMIAPEVSWDTKKKNKVAILKTKKFKSRAWIKGEAHKGEKETLTMLMVDLNYDGKVFDLDYTYYGEDLEANKWEAHFPLAEIGEKIMAVWIDHHGNESKAVIPRERFGLPKLTTVKKRRGKSAKK